MYVYDKSNRILKRVDFLKLTKNSTKNVTSSFIILVGTTANKYPRLGITVSKKIGNSVTRNHVKRLIREFFRLNKEKFPAFDYNIIARSGAGCLGYTAVCQELANALNRIGQRLNH